MIIRYVFPVRSNITLDQHWPLDCGRYKLLWRTNDQAAIDTVMIEHRTDSLQAAAKFHVSDKPGVADELVIGHHFEWPEIEQSLRTAQGILSLYGWIEVVFDEVKAEWEPETDEERKAINVHSFSRPRQKRIATDLRHIDFDIVGRAVAASPEARDYEVPLSFLRKAHRDRLDERYIEAYHNYFFFLETQFAPGFSNPKRVKEKLLASAEVLSGITNARRHIEAKGIEHPDLAGRIGGLTDEGIVNLLVDLRGTLHHHAVSRLGAWHPDKPEEFRVDTMLIGEICQEIALAVIVPILFADEQSRSIQASAERGNGITNITVRATDTSGAALPELDLPLFGRLVSAETISVVDAHFRANCDQMYGRGVDLQAYQIMSRDSSTLYAEYKRILAKNGDVKSEREHD